MTLPLIRLVLWMSHYYQSPAGQVFDTLIPSSVRSHAGTRERTYYSPSQSAVDEARVEALPKKQQAVLRLSDRSRPPHDVLAVNGRGRMHPGSDQATAGKRADDGRGSSGNVIGIADAMATWRWRERKAT